ncbi:MAG: hypothetical protein ACJ79Q_01595 [Gemmatimonadaceae bacterium]|jgi:hypothetical protein
MSVSRILIVASLCSPLIASAQSAAIMEWPVAAGTHVRIESPVLGRGLQKGNVAAATADTLVFQPTAREAFPISIATPNIVRLEVARGQATHKARGAGLGFLIGAGAGAILGAATYQKQECTTEFCLVPDSRSFDAFAGGVLLGAVGAVVGAFMGARPTETWVPVAIPRR